MSWIPGWASVAGTAWWSGFYFWVSIGALIALGMAEVASHRYSDRKDELAAIEQETTQSRHDDDIARVQHDSAQANERAAQLEKEAAEAKAAIAGANARAAEATQKAAEAQLELAKLKTPRALTAEQQSNVTEAAKLFPGIPFDLYIQPEPESLNLANQIADALTAAGWVWRPANTTVSLNRAGKPSVGMTTLTGVSIIVDTSKRSEWEAPALAVGNALHAAGIETAVQEVSDGSVSKDALRIGVGAKP